MTLRVTVIGGGVGGLAAALALGRAGYAVTLLEQDPVPASADAEEAFAAERRGAPQVHQTHGFLARLMVILRERFPDVLDDLRAVGGFTLPTTAHLGDPEPDDEDLAVIVVRRTTLEWVLRKAALAQPGVEIRVDTRANGLVVASAGAGGPVTVTGVSLDDGTTVDADVVVAATGRRSQVPAWLSAVGVDITETIHESGLMYVSRWYRLPEPFVLTLDAKLGGDLGFVKYLAVPGDAGTLSVTLAVRTDDTDLRHALNDPDRFDEACRILPGPDRFFTDGRREPIGGVRIMGGLLNRKRRFVDDGGAPIVLGFHAIGDAHTCTNPLYGRGCALAFAQAVLVADALAEHGADGFARAVAYEQRCAAEITPWFEVSVEMDRMGADPAGFGGFGGSGDGDGGGGEPAIGKAMAAVFVAAQTDPVIGRAFARFWNLLSTPADLAANAAFVTRVAEVMADPDAYPVPPREGPTRAELLESLAALVGGS